MLEKTKNAFESGDMDKTRQWLTACALINKSKLGVRLDVDHLYLDYNKTKLVLAQENQDSPDSIEKMKNAVLKSQITIYKKLKKQTDGYQKAKDFLDREGLSEKDMISDSAIKLIGSRLRID